MSRARKVWLIVGATVSTVLALGFPLAGIGTMWAVAALNRERLDALFARIPRGWGFTVAAWVSGMAVEVLAIADNRHLPPDERVLFHPDAGPDLAIAAVFYAILAIAWWLLLRVRDYSTWAVFLITGLWGAAIENFGVPLAAAIANPVAGVPLLAVIAVIYGTMTGLGAFVGRGSLARVKRDRPPATWRWHLIAMASLGLMFVLR